MKTPVLVVPTLGLDPSLPEKMAASVDFPVKDKVMINGGRPNSLNEFKKKHPDWWVIHYGRNLGFAGSVNQATYLYPNDDAFLLINDDGEFQPRCLERLCKASDEVSKDVHMIYVNEHRAFDICIWTRKCISDFGYFDENFFPSYYDDSEMASRFALGDFKFYTIPQPFPVKHGRPRPAGKAYLEMLAGVEPINRDYYFRKWGAIREKPLWNHPFNHLEYSLKYWSVEQVNRQRREAICTKFWNQENPSYYE